MTVLAAIFLALFILASAAAIIVFIKFSGRLHEATASARAATETRENLAETFKSLASDALRGNSQHFLELARTTLEKESELGRQNLDKKEQSIEHMMKPLKDLLNTYQKQVSEMERERQKSYSTVENELKRMATISSQLTQETTALKDALKKPHVRGRWGEVQLKNCIELAGMSEHADVTFQDAQNTDSGMLIPDMTVRMPGGRMVVVDAKTPIEAFIHSLDASTEEQRAAEMIRHGKHVKEHVKKLSTKDYAHNLPESADFTVMFLPNESFLYAALESEPDLVEYALQKKVLIATPPTLIGLLKVIRYGWNEERLAANAQKISEAGQELHKRIGDFLDAYTSIGKHLDKAKEEYNKGHSRLEHRVLVQARKLEKLGAKSKKSIPDSASVELLTDSTMS